MKTVFQVTLASGALAITLLVGIVPLGSAQGTTATPAATAEMAQGEIRKIDVENKKITLKHGEIKSLDMPPMTMVFGVKEASLLDALKIGDKIQFVAEKINGSYVVTKVSK